MRFPKSLEALADHGVIQEVLRPLMSGKEAQIYLVVADGEVCAAKIYKDAQTRSFKNRADYVEGRKVRNSRDQRAIAKGSKYGKSRDEDAWRSTEVEMIYRLRDAGVRVPAPRTFIDGVLVMELVQDPNGNPAPRLGDLHLDPDEALEIYHIVIAQVVRMLAAGVVHGDLSDFNVLLAWDGPVIIDFPQSVNAAGNQNARALLLRDVANLHRFAARFVPGFRRKPYAEEMWSLYENNRLTPESQLTGNFRGHSGPVDTTAVLALIDDANQDEQRRREGSAQASRAASPAPRRREIVINTPATPSTRRARGGAHGRADRPGGTESGGRHTPDTRRRQEQAAPSRDSGSEQRYRGPQARDGRPGSRSGDARGGQRAPLSRGGQSPAQQKGGPKRGAAARAAEYVSPEARKTKGLTLTPKVDPSSQQSQARRRPNRPQRASGRPGRERTEKDGRDDSPAPRRRRRRQRSSPEGSKD